MITRPDDLDIRIGELFSQVTIRSNQTALAALSEIVRRFDNPFVTDLDMKTKYGAAAAHLELRARAIQYVQGERGGAGGIALHAFVLWYLGERREAELAAERLRREFPDTVFARWSELMQAAVR